MIAALKPYVERGVPVIGLEPSCLLTLRDEFKAMLPGGETDALSGQLAVNANEDALGSDELYATLELCVSCKGCRRECPTGVDMAKMKVEFLHQYHQRHRLALKDRLLAYLPRYAPLAARFPKTANALQAAGKRWLGFAAQRSLPRWRRDAFLNSLRRWSGAGWKS